MKGLTHKQSHEMWERMREYKAEGHTMKEVADRFGVSKVYAQSKCKGIAPQRPKIERRPYIPTTERLKQVADLCEAAGLEYVGGYVSCDGFVTVKCQRCGTVFDRSMICIRKKNNVRCPKCHELEQEKKEDLKRKQNADYKTMLARQSFRRACVKFRQPTMKTCKSCGELFVADHASKIFCSDACANRTRNTAHKDKRIRAIGNAIIDKDIRLASLYERAGGVCALCGTLCDWTDFSVRKNGVVVAGNRYPSIDHIIPISRGGLHSWDNIQLAHRGCNTRKGNRVMPLIAI